MCHANINVNLMVENVIKIKRGITINVGLSVKYKLKKYIFGALPHVVASIIDNSVITCNEIIDAEEIETVPTNFNDV